MKRALVEVKGFDIQRGMLQFFFTHCKDQKKDGDTTKYLSEGLISLERYYMFSR